MQTELRRDYPWTPPAPERPGGCPGSAGPALRSGCAAGAAAAAAIARMLSISATCVAR
jgi:hypothetical protein